jgi:hypothetical protein
MLNGHISIFLLLTMSIYQFKSEFYQLLTALQLYQMIPALLLEPSTILKVSAAYKSLMQQDAVLPAIY